MSRWIRVCRLDDIPRRGARRVLRGDDVPIAVFRTADDRVFALLDRCPHKGGPLSQGIVFGESVACPLHNWTIGLADGCAKSPDEGCTQRFGCKVDAGEVLLELRGEADPAKEGAFDFTTGGARENGRSPQPGPSTGSGRTGDGSSAPPLPSPPAAVRAEPVEAPHASRTAPPTRSGRADA